LAIPVLRPDRHDRLVMRLAASLREVDPDQLDALLAVIAA
jgi:hypothetical protein